MSWLGDQLYSITDRITDFTKVLNENTTSDASTNDNLHHNSISVAELNNLCQEKDKKIAELLQEKENLQSSIEELDQQHEEAVNEIMSQKNQVAVQNEELRKRLENDDLMEVQTNIFNFLSKESIDCTLEVEKRLNLVKFLQQFCKNISPDCLQKYIKKIQYILEEKEVSEDIKKSLKTYIQFLEPLCFEKEPINKIIDELSTHLRFQTQDKANLESNISCHSQTESVNIEPHQTEPRLNNEIKTTQTEVLSVSHTNVQTDNTTPGNIFLCSSSGPDPKLNTFSQTEEIFVACAAYQTDDITSNGLTPSSESCQNAICSNYTQTEDLLVSHVILQTDHSSFENVLESVLPENNEVKQLTEHIEGLTEQVTKYESDILKLSNPSAINVSCECGSLRKELNSTLNKFENLKKKCIVLQKEHADNLNDLKEKMASQYAILAEKEAIVHSQKREILNLVSKLNSFKKLNEKEKSLKSDVDVKACNLVDHTTLLTKLNSLEKEMAKLLNVLNEKLQECDTLIKENTYLKTISDRQENNIGLSNLSKDRCSELDNKIAELTLKLNSIELEKNQLLSVLSEKSQECSGLKAEIHRLTSIVASEKQALLKLQQDNCDLKQSNVDPEMDKETIKKLSTIIRDQEFEIESLKQKNETLTTLIQDSSNASQHLQSILEERDNLLKQIHLYKEERENIMKSYNEKEKECQELIAELRDHRQKFDMLEQKHSSIARLYEEKQKSLVDTRNELVALKQRVTELERQQVDIKEKYSDLLNKINSDQSKDNEKTCKIKLCMEEMKSLLENKDKIIHDLSLKVEELEFKSHEKYGDLLSLTKLIDQAVDITKEGNMDCCKQKDKLALKLSEQIKELQLKSESYNLKEQQNLPGVLTIDEEYNRNLKELISSVQEKDHIIHEKNNTILNLSKQMKELQLKLSQQEEATANIGKKMSALTDELVTLNDTNETLKVENQNLLVKIQDTVSESNLFRNMSDTLNVALKEKEFAMQSMTEKISSLSKYISSGSTDVNEILSNSESMFHKAQDLCKEKDEAVLALNQSTQEIQSLRNEIQIMKNDEIHLKSELERLRQHLLEVEESYTTEAVHIEAQTKQLQDELVEAKRRAELTSTAVVDTNHRASAQIAVLQERLNACLSQRDDAQAQVSALEDQVQHQAAALNKLQLVLQQVQRGDEQKLKECEKRWQTVLQKEKDAAEEFERKLKIKELHLEESSQALEAASRLSEQLDAKEELIKQLKRELSHTESKVKSTAQEMDTIRSTTEGKVDRVVLKSLVLGYLSAPPSHKAEVVRLLARVLDFNQQEMEKAGVVVGRQTSGGLLSSIFNRLPAFGTAEQQARESFSSLFVRFLENESRPLVAAPFPSERLTPPIQTHSPLLLDMDAAFPTYTAPHILRTVLQPH